MIVFVFSCDDFFVEDISKLQIQLRTPSTGYQSVDKKISFRWEDVPNATNYKLEVVSPGFSHDHRLVFEKFLNSAMFDTILTTGEYEWRVKAMNSASETDFSFSSFTIQPPFNISTKTVKVTSPEDQAILKIRNVEFHWEALSGASYYFFKLKKISWAGDSIVATRLSSTNYTFRLDDGEYAWGVAAIDTLTKKTTDYTIRSIIVDQNPPSVPVPVSPANQDTINNQIVGFKWTKTESNASYTIEIYGDPGLKNKLQEKTASDTLTYINLEKSGIYYWRVNSKDEHGNASGYSAATPFCILLSSDIRQKTVQLMSPSNKSVLIEKKVTFWWNLLDGATKYNLQVVSPSFANPAKVIYDRWISSNSVSVDLEAGNYEWRVKAANGISETPFSQFALNVYFNDLSNQKVSLTKPLYGEQTNQSSIKFIWERLSGNVIYHLLVKKDSWESGTTVQEINTGDTEATLPLLDGDFYWGVKALDTQNNSETPYSVRKLFIDLTTPEIPRLLSPSNNLSTSDLLVNFSWEPSDAADTKLTYMLEMFQIHADVIVQLPSKTTQLKSLGYNFDSVGKYKWRVLATDLAGNRSAYSEFRFLEIK